MPLAGKLIAFSNLKPPQAQNAVRKGEQSKRQDGRWTKEKTT